MTFHAVSRLNRQFQWIALLMAVTLIGGSYGWIQGVAWVGMTVKGIQQYQSISQALDKTFDGEDPCSLCEAISLNQDQSPESKDFLLLKKQKEIPPDQYRILIRPSRPELARLPETVTTFSCLSDLPETPPPRLV
ncbi:MAG: hypothetical protein AAF649_06425 [Verrucomicrobiota bacterium]